MLGGLAFIGSGDVVHLHTAARALAFHPPARLAMTSALDDYLRGVPLALA